MLLLTLSRLSSPTSVSVPDLTVRNKELFFRGFLHMYKGLDLA